MTVYELALQELYQAPVANFLNERKRLAAELRAQGDEAGAAQVAKRRFTTNKRRRSTRPCGP